MPRRKYWQGINRALIELLEEDERVLVMGADVGASGGTFGATRGLQDRFGSDRVRDMPISEEAIVGAGIGLAVSGYRPIVEVLYQDFLMLALEPLVNQAATRPYFCRNGESVPLVIRTGSGVGSGMGAHHCQSWEAWVAGVPGVKVVWPSNAGDAAGLLKAAVADPGPVVFYETVADYGVVGELADGPIEPIALGTGSVVRAGDDVVLVTYGSAVPIVADAARSLAEDGVEATVVDLRTVSPWDQDLVADLVTRIGRAVVVTDAVDPFGPGAEIAARTTERCWDALQAPIARVASRPYPPPHVRSYEAARRPTVERIRHAVADVGVTSR